MKKNVILSVVMTFLFVVSAYAQKEWKSVNQENIVFRVPDNWTVRQANKMRGPVDINVFDPESKQFVEVKCERSVVDTKVIANDIATRRSSQPAFEQMQIDKIKKAKFKKNDAQFLSYTNTYLNDVYKGGIYSFVKEGYTYTVEYYGEDNPKTMKLLEDIINTIEISSADKKANMSDMANDYVADNWRQENTDKANNKEQELKTESQKKAEKELEKVKQKEEQAKQKAQKEIDKQQQKLEKQQKELEKQQQKVAKQQQKIEKQQQKAEKAKQKAEKEKQKAEKAKQKAEKEKQKKADKLKSLQKKQESIDKDIKKLQQKQQKLEEDFAQAQQKDDQVKLSKIQQEQTKISEKITKLNKDKESIEKKINKL